MSKIIWILSRFSGDSKLKMPVFDDPDFEVIDDITENGGIAEETKRKIGYTAGHLDQYLVEFCGGKNLQTICEEKSGKELVDSLTNALRGFFQTMKVKGKNGEKLPPKRNTSDCARSHLKKIIKKEAGLDLDSDEFEKFRVSISMNIFFSNLFWHIS